MRRSIWLFVFYFFAFFVLLFAWIRISKSEIPSEIPPPEPVLAVQNEEPDHPSQSEVLTHAAAKQIEQTSLGSAPGAQYTFIVRTTLSQAESLQSYLERILKSPLLEEKVTPITVELVDDRTEPRWKMTTDAVSLVVKLPSQSESIKVFWHELGHVIDLQFLKEGTLSSDPSELFYNISWIDYKTKKKGMALQDFVSGYAMTNKYEDFAESWTMFLFHNETFKARALKNPILQKKYDFFSEKVFKEREFEGTSFELKPLEAYFWDTTKLPIAVNKYLYYIK